MNQKLRTYHYKTDHGEYVSDMTKTDVGVYNYKTTLNNKLIYHETNLKLKTALMLEEHIRSVIKRYEKEVGVETPEVEETEETEELEDDEEQVMEQFEKETGKSAITSRNTIRKEYLLWKEQKEQE